MIHTTEQPLLNQHPTYADFQIMPQPQSKQLRSGALLGTVGLGLLAGIVGVAAMAFPERPGSFFENENSKTPAPRLERLFRKADKMGSKEWLVSHAVHWGQEALAKLAGPSMRNTSIPSYVFSGLRLSTDQVLENLFRSRRTLFQSKGGKRIDIFQKAVYAFATGVFADLLMKPQKNTSRPLT